MQLNAALESLYGALNASEGVVYVGWDQAVQWSEGVREQFIELGFLKGIIEAKSLECTGCENRCFMDIESVSQKGVKRSFIICDVPEMQAQMGRIPIAPERLQRWRFSVEQLARVIHGLLEFKTPVENLHSCTGYRLGWLQGAKGRQKVTIKSKPLALAVNDITAPIVEMLYFNDGELVIDRFRLDEMLVSKASKEKEYEPNQDRQAARKADTQERYASWQSAYLDLRKDNPTKTKTWISEKIEKMDIANGLDARTIYKNMTP